MHDRDRRSCDRDCRHQNRPNALGRAVRALRGNADDRPRRDDRERGAAVDPGGSRLLPERPRLGRERLPDRVRRPAAALGSYRRPDRAAAHLPHRPRRVHRGVAAVRDRPEPGSADRGPLRPGRRRRAHVRRHPRHDRDDVPGAPGAGQGDRRLRLRRLRRRLDRAARRRRADRGDQLALDLLHQPARRHRHRPAGPAPDRGRQGHRHEGGRRPPGRRAAHRRPDARRVHDPRRRGARLGLDPHARPRRHRRRPARRVRGPPGARRQPAHAAAAVPLAQRGGREPRAGAARGRHVRHVLPRRALHAADPGLQRARRRPRLPARDDRHGRHVAPLLRPADDALRPARDAAAEPRGDRGRAAAVRPDAGGRQLRPRHPALDGADGHRCRASASRR